LSIPSISVIIPNYNCSKWIRETLNSCLLQKKFLKEIIIVDDYSTDNSWEILSEYQARYNELIRIYRNKVKGGNNARNYGYALSTGDYIQWLDADDQLGDNKFLHQLKVFEEKPLADIVYSDWKLITYNDDVITKKELKTNRPFGDYLFELLMNNWSAPHTYLIRRKVAEQLHGINAWNPETIVMQDREYFTLAAAIGAKFSYTPGTFALYNRWSRSSVSAAGEKTRYTYIEKVLSRVEEVLHRQTWIRPEDLKRYQDVINTQKLLIRAAGFPSRIEYKNTGLTGIQWEIVKGMRTTAKFMVEYIRWRLPGK
jgi:glycosyltransferase involved in cell wall biosynthesis